MENPTNESGRTHDPRAAEANAREPKLLADDRRMNWSLLAVVCVAMGVLAAVLVGVFVVRAVSPGPLNQALHAVAKPADLGEEAVQFAPPPRPQTTTRALLPTPEGRAASDTPPGAASGANDVVRAGEQAAGLPGVELNPALGVVGQGSPAAPSEQTSAVPPTSGTASPVTAVSTTDATRLAPTTLSSAETDVPQAAPSEPPPAAALGYTYCGAVTCNVGFSCCCDVCVSADAECEPSACQAYSGLSVSVPCGMDLCASGDVCCDPRCGACARAGECPEEPCG